MTKRHNQHPNQQRPNRSQQSARADMRDMLNAFITTPELKTLQFQNEVGAIVLDKYGRDEQPKRMGFDTRAVGSENDNPADELDDEDEDEYDYGDEYEYDESEVRPAEAIWNYFHEIFKR